MIVHDLQNETFPHLCLLVCKPINIINYFFNYSYCISCYIMLYHVISCYIMLYHFISCYIMLYHVISCYIMLYYVKSCYIMLYYLIFPTKPSCTSDFAMDLIAATPKWLNMDRDRSTHLQGCPKWSSRLMLATFGTVKL